MNGELKYYLEEERDKITKKWKILSFLDQKDLEKNNVKKDENRKKGYSIEALRKILE